MIDEIFDIIDPVNSEDSELSATEKNESEPIDLEIAQQLFGLYEFSHLTQHSSSPLGLIRVLMALDSKYLKDDDTLVSEENIVNSAFNLFNE